MKKIIPYLLIISILVVLLNGCSGEKALDSELLNEIFIENDMNCPSPELIETADIDDDETASEDRRKFVLFGYYNDDGDYFYGMTIVNPVLKTCEQFTIAYPLRPIFDYCQTGKDSEANAKSLFFKAAEYMRDMGTDCFYDTDKLEKFFNDIVGGSDGILDVVNARRIIEDYTKTYTKDMGDIPEDLYVLLFPENSALPTYAAVKNETYKYVWESRTNIPENMYSYWRSGVSDSEFNILKQFYGEPYAMVVEWIAARVNHGMAENLFTSLDEFYDSVEEIEDVYNVERAGE